MKMKKFFSFILLLLSMAFVGIGAQRYQSEIGMLVICMLAAAVFFVFGLVLHKRSIKQE